MDRPAQVIFQGAARKSFIQVQVALCCHLVDVSGVSFKCHIGYSIWKCVARIRYIIWCTLIKCLQLFARLLYSFRNNSNKWWFIPAISPLSPPLSLSLRFSHSHDVFDVCVYVYLLVGELNFMCLMASASSTVSLTLKKHWWILFAWESH